MNKDVALLIPILVPLGAFLMVFGIQYLKNQERMAMIQKGMMPPMKEKEFSPSRTFRNALVLIGVGLGLLTAKMIDDNYFYNNQDDDRAVPYYFACVAIGAGVGLLIAYIYERKNPTIAQKGEKFEDMV
jgi:dipeptide/tripeptide permease